MRWGSVGFQCAEVARAAQGNGLARCRRVAKYVRTNRHAGGSPPMLHRGTGGRGPPRERRLSMVRCAWALPPQACGVNGRDAREAAEGRH